MVFGLSSASFLALFGRHHHKYDPLAELQDLIGALTLPFCFLFLQTSITKMSLIKRNPHLICI